MHQPEGPLTSFLFCGAPDDPATPPAELANLHATLTEIYHFNDSEVSFAAQYGCDGPRLIDEGKAFDSNYLLTLTHRTPEARRDAMAHLGSYLFHELTTPLGMRLERLRSSPSAAVPQFRHLWRMVPARFAPAPGGARRLPAHSGRVAIRRPRRTCRHPRQARAVAAR